MNIIADYSTILYTNFNVKRLDSLYDIFKRKEVPIETPPEMYIEERTGKP